MLTEILRGSSQTKIFTEAIEKFRVAFKRHTTGFDFVPRDQVFAFHVDNYSLILQKITSFSLVISIRIVLDSYQLISVFFFRNSHSLNLMFVKAREH